MLQCDACMLIQITRSFFFKDLQLLSFLPSSSDGAQRRLLLIKIVLSIRQSIFFLRALFGSPSTLVLPFSNMFMGTWVNGLNSCRYAIKILFSRRFQIIGWKTNETSSKAHSIAVYSLIDISYRDNLNCVNIELKAPDFLLVSRERFVPPALPLLLASRSVIVGERQTRQCSH